MLAAPRCASLLAAFWLAGASLRHAPDVEPRPLYRYEASRLSMACEYAIEAYGPDRELLPHFVDEAFDEVDRIDRLMSHYDPSSSLSRINREAAHHPVAVEPELFDFIADAMRYQRDSEGAFDITVGSLMKAWGFFRGEGRVPSDDELAAARHHVGGGHVLLDLVSKTIRFDEPGVALDLGGIAKGYAVDRAIALFRRRQVTAVLVSAGGSTIYGLGAPPGRAAWDVMIQDPIDSRKIALTLHLKDRALSVAGRSGKSFDDGGVTYSHIMDPRTGRPVTGMLSVAVLAATGTAGDALDNAFFVLGPEGSRAYLRQLRGTEVFFFLAAQRRPATRGWTMVHRRAAPPPT